MLIASKAGEVDIQGWYNDHKKYDRERLQKDLEKYSSHELDVIRDLLKDKEKDS